MSLVFKRGYVLGHGIADVLIENGTIQAIGDNLDGKRAINASGKLIVPGFVDTHRHMAQAPLRGLGPDMPLGYYLERVVQHIGASMTVLDVRNSLKLAAAEAMNAGVTTVLDWSAVSAPDQVDAAIEVLGQTGLRVVFGHSNPDDMRPEADAVASLGPDYLPVDVVARHIGLARERGLITSMHVGGQHGGGVRKLHDAGLLGPDVHFVHGNRLEDDEFKMLVDYGCTLTVTPVTELLMGHGDLAYRRFAEAGGQPALGVDVEIGNVPDMFSEMRAGLMAERARGTLEAREMLKAATINGAKAIGLGDAIGSLEAGKRADIVLLTGLEHLFGEDPAVIEGAVVTSVGTEDVHTVLIDGTVVKLDGVLVDHDLRELRELTLRIARRTLAAAAG
ncbi:amidohydrolase family protein [Kibdelosporangium aridum]|uniref:Cytosine/adenosine deaminase n=1 Tax=Kibdelosporangium aridum TaxID=2030 RepID=A0A1W2FR63_KIBAR|nr:amidohydrolase family protein [Kibdelosporangium aridum]SMD24098.1 Cytosine/adenosine deaminase [Kibdelosporangium aridum]